VSATSLAGLLVLIGDGPHKEAAQTELNKAFPADEVYQVLCSLRRNSAPGVDRIPTEWYKYAACSPSDTCVRAITKVFNLIWESEYPKQWASSALVPVPKPKGCKQDKDNYRGIAVSNAIGKIFSLCLMHRLDAWAEKFDLRAAGQFGFRKERGTADASFVLNHLIDQHRERGKPLYVAFIDFKKAYDWVDRDLLWDCLNKLGVSDPFLSTLRSMYNNVRLQIRMHGKLGTPFPSVVGVKQGDPLSPLLFGLLIDRMELYFKSNQPDEGVKVLGTLLQLLMYADDVAQCSESPS